MDTVVRNYYIGFEGEPEIQFIRCSNTGKKLILRIWSGYFDSIMSSIKPGVTGWTGLSYQYHMHEGWYDESPWEIQDVKAAIMEFQGFDGHGFNEQTLRVWTDICEFLKAAQSDKDSVYISYE